MAAWATLLSAVGTAAPTLTTIQDTLYKADGTKFSGTLTIQWKTFEAADTSNIPTQMLTVKVLAGVLHVQLVPTANAKPSAFYTVRYNSDGKIQFNETWNVPTPGSKPLRVRDVRAVATAPIPLQPTLVDEADVSGLLIDLEARPTKGFMYTAAHTAMINDEGQLEAVTGNAGDCVRVNGSAGPCGGAQPVFSDAEVPGGLVDGANAQFSLLSAPNPPSSLQLYLNGMYQKAGYDYTLSGGLITFIPEATPQPGDTMMASYRAGTALAGGLTANSGVQVLCNGGGQATTSNNMVTLGGCMVAPRDGDRIEIRFDYSHEGTASGMEFQVLWGSTLISQRSGTDMRVTGKADAVMTGGAAQISNSTWGTTLPLQAGLTGAADALPVTINFRGRALNAAGDSVTLRGFTVLRYPGQ